MLTRIEAAFVLMMAGRDPFRAMADEQRRRSRQHATLSQAWAVSSFESVRTAHSVGGTFARTLTGGTNPISGGIDVQKSKTWALGTAVDQISQPLTTTLSIAGGATNNFDLSGVMTNVVGDALGTLTGIKHILVELISVAQDSVNGTACSGITIGNHATAAWIGPFGATGTYTIKNGGYLADENPTAAGWPVTATTADLLKIVNNDGAVAAFVRITILGIP